MWLFDPDNEENHNDDEVHAPDSDVANNVRLLVPYVFLTAWRIQKPYFTFGIVASEDETDEKRGDDENGKAGNKKDESKEDSKEGSREKDDNNKEKLTPDSPPPESGGQEKEEGEEICTSQDVKLSLNIHCHRSGYGVFDGRMEAMPPGTYRLSLVWYPDANGNRALALESTKAILVLKEYLPFEEFTVGWCIT